MILSVDFNRVDKAGRPPARIPPGQECLLVPGVEVTASDGEGTECLARVDEIGHKGRYVLLAPVVGTFRDQDAPRTALAG